MPRYCKAEPVLECMEQAYRINGKNFLQLNVITYTTVINLLFKVPNPNLATKYDL